MATKPKTTPTWLEQPEAHDFPAAEHFLALMLHRRHAARALERLHKQRKQASKFAAKDILRAAELACLPSENEGVAAKLAKVRAGEPLAPVMLVRPKSGPLIIADGYHRVSAAHILDESTMVPSLLVSVP